ncbi:putative amino-acid N-acetyltransferase subunit Mak10 [Xylona heveae TC161]|uniref:Putative amino-acid N-acetyltransferase subunit Mak10 n=1 Tax=Xylona heveae (strain CBS 132557 / TC161) TaxID=1328760 RepID=A0A165F851_XYLHT|nr:putative amino-acid N-acetyltransferase subunit Mak10 [Xylona heveae TC161]KZF20686.1 putative amino-acid N-acetyltransferase subunit Mak10 [Xylona heveae TC161]
MDRAGEDATSNHASRLEINNQQMPPPLSRPDPVAPPPPISSLSRITVRDITTEFRTAASALQIGQLVKDASFTLFESVGALEIMDPKMDSGYLEPGETLDEEYDVLRELNPEELLGIMDQLVFHEMAWHMGYPLSQTLFTSTYIDRLLWPDPRTLNEAAFSREENDRAGGPWLNIVLRAYSLALIKTCDIVHKRIGVEHCYEEEDFVTHLYNRRLLSDIPENQMSMLLEEAISWTASQKGSIGDELYDALQSRLKFRAHFLRAIAFDLQLLKERSNPYWQQCLELLPSVQGSHGIGKPIPESFSIKIQRKLTSTVPPRPIVNISSDDAFPYLKRLCQDGSDITRMLDCQGANNVLTFVWVFQSRKPQPAVYIRSLMQSLLFGGDGILGDKPYEEFFLETLAETVLPAHILLDPKNNTIEAPNHPRFQVAEKMNLLVDRAEHPYTDIFRTICQNRSRIRRMLCHSIIEFDNLQLEVEELDVEFQKLTKEEPILDRKVSSEAIYSFPLSSWVYYQKLLQMQWVVQLGFELEVYHADELAGMYWYLQSLASTRLHHLTRIRGFVARSMAKIQRPTSQEEEAFAKTLTFLKLSMLEAMATLSFAEGLSSLYTALSRLSTLPGPGSRPYSTPALRYELRMKPFLPLSLPNVPPYEEFTESVTRHHIPTTRLLNEASAAIGHARRDFEQLARMDADEAGLFCRAIEPEWRAGVKDALKACISASLATVTAAKTIDVSGKSQPQSSNISVQIPDVDTPGRYHDWWVVPKVDIVKQ